MNELFGHPKFNKGTILNPLPHLETLEVTDSTNFSAKLVAMDSNDARSRPFNLLRAQIIKKLGRTGNRIIGVTSAAPGAGKSFVASNLAASLGMLPNRNTYLIDLDLRRASIADIFGIVGTVGLTEFLLGDQVELEAIGRRIGTSNLAVFPSFPALVNSAELMVGERFDSLLAGARALPDDSIVIIDLPPIFANDDAILVAEQLDGVLLIVEQGVTTKKQLQSALQFISPTPLIGTIFNRFDGGIGDPYGYGDKYDGYYRKVSE